MKLGQHRKQYTFTRAQKLNRKLIPASWSLKRHRAQSTTANSSSRPYFQCAHEEMDKECKKNANTGPVRMHSHLDYLDN